MSGRISPTCRSRRSPVRSPRPASGSSPRLARRAAIRATREWPAPCLVGRHRPPPQSACDVPWDRETTHTDDRRVLPIEAAAELAAPSPRSMACRPILASCATTAPRPRSSCPALTRLPPDRESARATLEANGLPTVIIGSALDIVEHCGVPRFVFTDLPLGNPVGHPWNRDMQRDVVRLALRTLDEAAARARQCGRRSSGRTIPAGASAIAASIRPSASDCCSLATDAGSASQR